MGFFTRNDEPKKVSVFDLKIGDIVTIDETNYTVGARLTFHVGSYEWYEFMLKENGETRWLTVEEDDEVLICLSEEIDLELDDPVPHTITYEGIDYHLEEEGEAEVDREGAAGRKKTSICNYWDYEDASSERVLSVEVWGNDMEVSVGEYLDEEEIIIYPHEK